MTPYVLKAMEEVEAAATKDGILSWFLAIRDPDSNERHCRIHGDLEMGYGMAHLALGAAASSYVKEAEAPNLHIALRDRLTAVGVQTWFFTCKVPKAGEGHNALRMSYATATTPEAALGLGVVCLHMMVAGQLAGNLNVSFRPDPSQFPPPADPPPPPPAAGG